MVEVPLPYSYVGLNEVPESLPRRHRGNHTVTLGTLSLRVRHRGPLVSAGIAGTLFDEIRVFFKQVTNLTQLPA